MGKKSIYLLLAGLGFFFLKWKEDMNITLTHQPYVEKSQLPTASTGPLETGPGDTPSPLSETAQSSIIQTSEPPAVVVPPTTSDRPSYVLMGTGIIGGAAAGLGAAYVIDDHARNGTLRQLYNEYKEYEASMPEGVSYDQGWKLRGRAKGYNY